MYHRRDHCLLSKSQILGTDSKLVGNACRNPPSNPSRVSQSHQSSAGRCSRTRRGRAARRAARLASSKNDDIEELWDDKWCVGGGELPLLLPLLLLWLLRPLFGAAMSSVTRLRRVFLSGVKIFSWHRLACSQSRAARVVVRRGVSSRSNLLASRSRRWEARSSHCRMCWSASD